jgi:hypothetical protein
MSDAAADAAKNATTSLIDLPPGCQWWMAVLLSAVAGFFGGLGTGLMEELTEIVSLPDRDEHADASPLGGRTVAGDERRILGPWREKSVQIVYERIAIKGILGALTAVCGLFIFILSPIRGNLAPQGFWVVLASASTLFGVVGQRLLPAIEKSFGHRLGLVEEKVTDAETRLTKVRDMVRNDTLFAEAVQALNFAYKAKTPTPIEVASRKALQAIKLFPRDKRVNHDLAFLWFECAGDSESEKQEFKRRSIELMTKYIAYLEGIPIGQRDDEFIIDLATSYYNRACIVLNPPSDPDDPIRRTNVPRAEEVNAAREDLVRAINLRPKIIKDIEKDEDLRVMWGEELDKLRHLASSLMEKKSNS